MLAADKAALSSALARDIVNLQAKELNYLQTNLQSIATVSSVLTGFAFSSLSLFKSDDLESNLALWRCWGFDQQGAPIYNDTNLLKRQCFRLSVTLLVDALFTFSSALSLLFNLLATLVCTLSSLVGPGLALRGPDGSLGVALMLLEQQNKRALRFLGRGLVFLSVSILIVGLESMCVYSFIKGFLVVCVGFMALTSIMYYSADIGSKFYVAVNSTVRGEFNLDMNHIEKMQETMTNFSFFSRCRPGTQSYFSVLWRLDRMVVLPYHRLYYEKHMENSSSAHIALPTDGAIGMISKAQTERMEASNADFPPWGLSSLDKRRSNSKSWWPLDSSKKSTKMLDKNHGIAMSNDLGPVSEAVQWEESDEEAHKRRDA